MTIKDRIIRVLQKQNLTFKDLSEILEIDEDTLSNHIEKKVGSTMEKISKVIRVPLYSFWREDYEKKKDSGKDWYNEDIWGDD